jgi:hypothetical protein
MSNIDWILKLLQVHPGSIGIMILSSSALILHVGHLGKKALTDLLEPRFHAIELKLGIVSNGKPLEQVVTKADLNDALNALFYRMDNKFIDKEMCKEKHDRTVDEVKNLKESVSGG